MKMLNIYRRLPHNQKALIQTLTGKNRKECLEQSKKGGFYNNSNFSMEWQD